MNQHSCAGEACSNCGDRVPLKSPVDVEALVFMGEDGNEYMYVRAVMEREREHGPVTVKEDMVVREGTIVGHRRRCESSAGETIEQSQLFNR